MSETAAQYLTSLLSAYTPPAAYFEAHRAHRAGIETRLDLWLGVKEMFETGSLKHGTGVRYYSDADFIVSLKGERPMSTTSLNKVKDALQDRYPSTTIVIRRPAVVCRFKGGDETVEVVPAFAADSGYWIPDPKEGGWMLTHPKDHNAYVNTVNTKHSGGAKKLARLAKMWKYQRNVPVSSCYLEMRAAKYADAELSWFLPADLYYFLKGLEAAQLAAMNDPTGLGSRFTAYSSEGSKADALSKLSTAVSRAKRAMDFDAADNNTLAVGELRLLFNE